MIRGKSGDQKIIKSLEIKYSLSFEDTSLDDLAKMQSSRYWTEKTFQDAKGNCGMAECMVRNWNTWHRHMALVMLSRFILSSYQKKFEKIYNISFLGIILILKYHNPLKIIDAWEIARILNQDNEMRMRLRVSRLRYPEE